MSNVNRVGPGSGLIEVRGHVLPCRLRAGFGRQVLHEFADVASVLIVMTLGMTRGRDNGRVQSGALIVWGEPFGLEAQQSGGVALAAARVVCEVLQKPWDVYGDKENFIWTLGQLRPEQRA